MYGYVNVKIFKFLKWESYKTMLKYILLKDSHFQFKTYYNKIPLYRWHTTALVWL